MAETIFLLGEGGAVFPFDLPLNANIQDAFDKGRLRRVNEDGSPYFEDARPRRPGRPRKSEQADQQLGDE